MTFQKGLLKNGKIENVLEFDIKKYGRIILYKQILANKDYPFNWEKAFRIFFYYFDRQRPF